MKERPILFSAPMVRAILEGRKTQTRRVIDRRLTARDQLLGCGHEMPADKIVAWFGDGPDAILKTFAACPQGSPGDKLWVREAFMFGGNGKPLYWATDENTCRFGQDIGFKRRPSIHMPRWVSRLTLLVRQIRVQRLQEISESDAEAEGVKPWRYTVTLSNGATVYVGGGSFTDHSPIVGAMLSQQSFLKESATVTGVAGHYREAYAKLWDEINGSGAWAQNPWVWVIDFTRVA